MDKKHIFYWKNFIRIRFQEKYFVILAYKISPKIKFVNTVEIKNK